MGEYDASPRPLVYPLKNSLSIIRTTEDDTGEPVSSFVWPEDSDERVLVPFMLSLNEYNVLANTIDVGRDIAYGDDSIRVLWLWLRNMRENVSICSMIIACIMSDDDTKEAFRNFILNDPAINQHITDIAANQVLSLEKRLTNILKPDVCDPDFLFNQASVLVQLLHDLSEDIFEAIEVGTNQLERADILVGAIPAAGLNSTAAAIFELADQLIEDIQESYSGSYDEAMFDVLRCAIFCAVRDDCELNLTKIIGIYSELLAAAVPDDPIEALSFIMTYLVTGEIGGNASVYGMHLLVLTAIQAGTDLLGINFAKLANRVLAAGDDGNNDWEVLCEDCNEPEPPDPECIIFSEGEFGWSVAFSIGEYHSGVGYGPIDAGSGYWALYVHKAAFTYGPVKRAVLVFSTAVTNIGYAHDNGTNGHVYTGAAATEITFDIDSIEGWNDPDTNQGVFIQTVSAASLMTSSTRLLQICLYLD